MKAAKLIIMALTVIKSRGIAIHVKIDNVITFLFMKLRDKINQELVYTNSRKRFWDFFWLSV